MSDTQQKENTMKLTIDGTEYEYQVRYINNRAVAIGYRADLYGAYLAGANLAGAYLAGADLTRANLAGADLTDAYLTGANLAGAKNLDSAYGLSTVKGEPASLPEGWEYTEGKGIHKEEA